MDNRQFIEMAKKECKISYSPYSKIKVGAALVSENGEIFEGCNIENASYGLSMCAERVVLFKAVSEGQKKFTKIAVASSSQAAPPCGACRQVLSEFSPEMEVVWEENGKIISKKLNELLPHSFGLKK